MRYRHVGNHIEDLDDGRQVVPGDYVDLDEDQLRQDRTEELVGSGTLIPAEKEAKAQEEAEKEAKLAERRTKSSQRKSEEGGTEES